jgi:hypothetical protein
MGGNNSLDNLVNLTAKEHFICHLLLTKMVEGQNKFKMIKAARMMSYIIGPKQQRYKVNSRIYETLMKKYIEVPVETRKRISIAQKARYKNMPGTFLGKTHAEETKKKMSKSASKPKSIAWKLSASKNRKGKIPPNKGKTFEELYGKDKANQIKEKQRHVGASNGFFGKQHSPEQREKKRQEKLAAPKKICYYCSKEVDTMNYGRWHGDKCKLKK